MTTLPKIKTRKEITPDLIAKVRNCAASGCNFPQTAIICGIEEGSLKRWMVSAYNDGRANAVCKAGATLFNLAMGDEVKGRKPNIIALIFFLKCQGGWRETTGIVFEAGDDNKKEIGLVELLNARLNKLATIASKQKSDGTESS